MKHNIFFIFIFFIFTSSAFSLTVSSDRCSDDIPKVLLDGFITSMSSKDKILAVGSWDGIFICNLRTLKWKSGSDYRGEFPKFITSVFVENSNEIYIGTSFCKESGLYKLESNLISKINVKEDSSLNVTAIYKFNGKLYIGTFGDGLYVGSNNNFSKIDINGEFITSINGIKNKIYVGTKYKGIFCIENGNIEIIDEHTSELPNNSVSAIDCCDTDEIWIGGWGGASRIKNGKWTTFFKYEKQLLNSNVKCIVNDDEYLYLGTDLGISVCDKNDNFTNINSKKYPLPSDNILSLCKTKKYLWIGTDKGLIKIGNTK